MSGAIPLIIAHRGASSHAPENTVAAIAAAVDAGADGVEFDVRLSSDGVPVVFHDADLTRIGGRHERICDLTADDLANVDVGKWFAAKEGNSSFKGETIPTLGKVMEFLDGFGGRIYIELKAEDENYQDLAAGVADVIRGSAAFESVVVKSFRLGLFSQIKALLPGVRTAGLFGPQILTYLRRKRYIVALAGEFGADELSLHTSLAGRKLCKLAGEVGMPVTIWTADNERWITRSREREIHALITNDPAKMLAARDAV